MNAEKKKRWMKQMRSVWELRDTEELLNIWQMNNREELIDEAFEVIGEILKERIGEVPSQNIIIPIDTKKETKPIYKQCWPLAIFGIIVLLLIVFSVNYFIRQKYWVIRDETNFVTLTKSNNPVQLVYEDNDIKISIGYDQFLDFARAEQKTKVNGRFAESKDILLDEEDKYLIAEALELGKATVFDKRNQMQVKRIYIRYYEYWCGALCGSGTRSFYLPNKYITTMKGYMFLEVLDWVS